jgi:nucleoid-associated protein YgaU
MVPPTRPPAAVTLPVMLRVMLAVALAVILAVLLAGVAAPALADLIGLPLPDRTTGSALTTTSPAVLGGAHTVVVRRGDTLWSISARLLAGTATDARVVRTWHRLHRLNLARIGPDPDLILPGTRLVVPPAPSAHRKEAS